MADCANRNQHLGWKAKLIHFTGFIDFLSPESQRWIGPADIIVIQRNVIDENVHNAIDYWQGMGKAIAVDLDDAYHILPWSNPAKRFWHLREADYKGEIIKGAGLKWLEEGLHKVGALIAPNHHLLSDWAHLCRGYYLQNYAETDWWTDLPPRTELKKERGLEDKIIIGWGGSISHYDSWWGSGIFGAAERVSQRHPNIMWLICGNDDRLYNQLPVPKSQKMKQAGVPPQDWPKTVQCFDIGVAPLYGIYDQRRSWIKGIEYALATTPWVGTDGPVYREVADTGGILVSPGVEAWEDALEEKIKNLKQEQELMAMRLPEYQDRFLVDNNLQIYEQVYKKIIVDQQGSKNRILPGVVKIGAN